jgi:hypothetical protein
LKGQTNFDAGPLFPDRLFMVRVNTGLMTCRPEAEKVDEKEISVTDGGGAPDPAEGNRKDISAAFPVPRHIGMAVPADIAAPQESSY